MAAAERHLLEAEYADGSASGAAFCRSAALIVSHHFLRALSFRKNLFRYKVNLAI